MLRKMFKRATKRRFKLMRHHNTQYIYSYWNKRESSSIFCITLVCINTNLFITRPESACITMVGFNMYEIKQYLKCVHILI